MKIKFSPPEVNTLLIALEYFLEKAQENPKMGEQVRRTESLWNKVMDEGLRAEFDKNKGN